MATTIDLAAAKDALIVLGAAAVVVPVMQRLRIDPVIAYLGAGVLVGPHVMGTLAGAFPALSPLAVENTGAIAALGEFGVVFLLFVVGLELSFARLMLIRRLVIGLGGLQLTLSTLIIAALALPFAGSGAAALMIGAALALSSTAIVVELLSAQGRITSGTGRASFAVLLMQDLAIVPVLILIAVLGSGQSLAGSLATAAWQAAAVIGFIFVAGRFLLRPLFRLVAARGDNQFFVAAVLFVAVGAGAVAAAAGLSMALGALIAGLLLAETEYRRSIEATIEPFKSLLLGVFFFTVGLSIDLRVVASSPLLIVGGVVVLVAVKALLIFGLAILFRLARRTALEMSLLLAPGGEFAFVVAVTASAVGLLDAQQATVLTAVTALSMILIPGLGAIGRRLGDSAAKTEPINAAPLPEDGAARAILVGYGRVGRLVADIMDEHKVPYLVLDADAKAVALWRRTKPNIYWGEASRPGVLSRCGLAEATALIVTVDNPTVAEAVVTLARQARPTLPIVARSRDPEHSIKLYGLGVTDAVPETVEASLQLSEAALAALDLPAGPVIASIHDRRDRFREELRAAAGRETRAIATTRRRHEPGPSA